MNRSLNVFVISKYYHHGHEAIAKGCHQAISPDSDLPRRSFRGARGRPRRPARNRADPVLAALACLQLPSALREHRGHRGPPGARLRAAAGPQGWRTFPADTDTHGQRHRKRVAAGSPGTQLLCRGLGRSAGTRRKGRPHRAARGRGPGRELAACPQPGPAAHSYRVRAERGACRAASGPARTRR